MPAILIAILGYFLTALEAVTSKFLLSSRVKSWKLYVFYVGLLSLFTLVFAPFGLHWYGWNIFWVSFFSGVALFFYLVVLYRELERNPASVVYVVSGAVSTIGALVLSRIFLLETLGINEALGIGFLLLGGMILALRVEEMRFAKGTAMIFLAGILFAIFLVLLKGGFNDQNFISGYVYSRIGEAAATFAVFLIPSFRKEVLTLLRKKDKKESGKQFLFVTIAKILAGLGSLLINIGIYWGSVTVVNALIATQYLFIFILSLILSFYFKNVFAEERELRSVVIKSVGMVLVIVGVVLVSVY